MTKRIGALLLAIPLVGAGVVTNGIHAAAGSAGTGCELTGAIPEKDYPVVVEREHITLHIGDLAGSGYFFSSSALEQYLGRNYVKTEYSFYNPTEERVDMKLLIPDMGMPDYVTAGYSRPYVSISTDGASAEYTPRYSYAGFLGGEYDLSDGASQISDGVAGDFYFREGLEVTEWTFSVVVTDEMLEQSAKKHLSLVVRLSCNPITTRIMSSKLMYAEISNGEPCLCFDLEKGMNKVRVAAVGGSGSLSAESTVRTARFGGETLHSMVAVSTGVLPFREFALRNRPAGCEISESDWINGFVRMITECTNQGCLVYAIPDFLTENSFLRWQEYTVSVDAKERVLHTVTTPIFPVVSGEEYQFSYLLSTDQRWSDLNQFSIEIVTPYHVAETSLDFQRTEGADGNVSYAFRRDFLPLGELEFTLTDGTVTGPGVTSSAPISPSLRLAFILLGVLTAAAGGTAVAVVVIRKKKRAGSGRKDRR